MKVSTSRGAVELLDLPLACCGLESSAVSWTPGEGEPVAAVLCISGTISTKTAPMVVRAFEQLKASQLPVKVIAVGACASSGGPYWDSPTVISGASQVLPVDLLVPGCPPRPDQIKSAVEQVLA